MKRLAFEECRQGRPVVSTHGLDIANDMGGTYISVKKTPLMAGFSRHWPLPRRALRLGRVRSLDADRLDAHKGTSIDAPSFCEGHAMPLNCLDIYGIDRVV